MINTNLIPPLALFFIFFPSLPFFHSLVTKCHLLLPFSIWATSPLPLHVLIFNSVFTLFPSFQPHSLTHTHAPTTPSHSHYYQPLKFCIQKHRGLKKKAHHHSHLKAKNPQKKISKKHKNKKVNRGKEWSRCSNLCCLKIALVTVYC